MLKMAQLLDVEQIQTLSVDPDQGLIVHSLGKGCEP
jgi:hypothetical protein